MKKFYKHLTIYIIVNIALIVIDLRDGSLNWAFYPIIGWGIGLAFDFFDEKKK